MITILQDGGCSSSPTRLIMNYLNSYCTDVLRKMETFSALEETRKTRRSESDPNHITLTMSMRIHISIWRNFTDLIMNPLFWAVLIYPTEIHGEASSNPFLCSKKKKDFVYEIHNIPVL